MTLKKNPVKKAIIITPFIACFLVAVVLSIGIHADSSHPIMANNSVTIGQMINMFTDNASYPSYYGGSDAPTIYDFCATYYEECEREGVDVCVAFSQAMVETGFLRFGGSAKINQYNFAGIGTRADNPGESYSSVREGIRAHVQRLKIYASDAPLSAYSRPLAKGVAEAYSSLSWLRGDRCYVEDLNTWGGSSSYYQAVLNMMARLSAASTYTTWYEGVDYSSVYDPYFYASHYSDVRRAFGDSGDNLIRHFINNGMNEGRLGRASFDVQSYRRQYPDLRRAFGNSLKYYYLHYISNGRYEGRRTTGCTKLQGGITTYDGVDYSAVYSYDDYSTYSDLIRAFGEDDIAMLRHFVNNGMYEGRKGRSTFDVQSYRRQYADLRAAFGYNLKSYYLHYISNGRYEGRKTMGCTTLQGGVTTYEGIDYSAVYSYSDYSQYSDLKRAFGEDDIAMLRHFVNNGMYEGRVGKSTFDVQSYKRQYADLRAAFGSNLKAYYMHYISNGRYEGRKTTGCTTLQGGVTTYEGIDYSAVYSYSDYSQYSDLRRAFGEDDVAMLRHFVEHGMHEGRVGRSSFNVNAYKNRYSDLRAAFGNNLKAYYIHYINHGVYEKRIAV